MTAASALPRVIGHRGAAASAPENTLASFRRAHELGAAWVELDVQLSADGMPVVAHDGTLIRTANNPARIAEITLAELRAFDVGLWFAPAFQGETIPTLEEALTLIAAQGQGVNIELKCPSLASANYVHNLAEATAQAASRVWPKAAPLPIYSSFSRAAVAAVGRCAPNWPRAWICERLPTDWRSILQELGAGGVHLDHRHLSPAAVISIKAAGYWVASYTVNTLERAKALWAMGVDAVFSDCPDRLLVA